MSVALPAETAVAPPARRRVLASGGFGELWRLALADVRERTRRTGFVISMAVMVWLAHGMMPGDTAGYRTFVMNDRYRPEYGAAWVGALSATLTTVYFLFVGFYLVKGAVERDRRTGVGQILAAARVRGVRYLFAKTLSNATVLMLLSGVVLVTAFVMQQVLGEDRRIDVVATVLPFLWVTLPAALFVSAMAVLFDCVRFLRGGLGNVAWFFLLGVLLSNGATQGRGASPFLDLTGGIQVSNATLAANERTYPGSTRGGVKNMSMGLNVDPRWKTERVLRFPLGSMRWDAREMAPRLFWVLLSGLVVFAASLVFDRFDAAPAPMRGRRAARTPDAPPLLGVAVPRPARDASELTVAPRAFAFGSVLAAELRLLLKGQHWVWHLGLLAALITGTFVPLTGAREWVLPIASLWPVLVWSALGSRERREGTAPLFFSCPRPLTRLLSASWLAGALLALLIGAPLLVRMALAGDGPHVLGLLVGAAFVPALALALGVWTGSGKFFEVLYLMLWYAGPMHHIAELDYTGVTTARPLAWTLLEAALAALLLAAAWWGRARQLRN